MVSYFVHVINKQQTSSFFYSSRIQIFWAASEPEELVLGACNAFVHKLVFQAIGQHSDSSAMHLKSRFVCIKNLHTVSHHILELFKWYDKVSTLS